MYKVQWSTFEMLIIIDRWFHDRDAALAYAKTRQVAVVFDKDGRQIF